jgi:hypothetical protein
MARTCDRYTAVYLDRAEWGYDKDYFSRRGNLYPCVGMNSQPFHPQGFGQHSECMLGRHLGKRIDSKDLPPDCQKLIRQDLGL